MKQLLDSLQEQWNNMSKRERNLALITAVAAFVFIGWNVIQSAQTKLDNLNARIDQLQEQAVNATAQISRKQQVEKDYAAIASQHSSAWDKYEVYERLRQEIFRLAQRVPPALDEKGVPMRSSSDGGVLVKIPELQQGTMEDTDDGYREYKISFRIPEVELMDLFNFLDRLRQSPQSLRIDGLTFAREWNGTKVAADIDLTRIIVSGSAAVPQQQEAPAATAFADIDLDPARWTAESGALQSSDHGLVLESKEDNATLYLEQPLPGAASYDCVIELSSTGRGVLAIAGTDSIMLPGAEKLPADGQPYRVHLQFTVPGKRGEAVIMRVPYVTLKDFGAQVEIRGMSLRRAEG